MRFASPLVYLALSLASLAFATNFKDIVTPVFSAGAGSLSTGVAWMGLIALAFRLWFVSAFVEYLAACAGKKLPLAALTYRATSITELWAPNRAWVWGLVVGEAIYDRGFTPPLFVALAIQGCFLALESKRCKGKALWQRLPAFIGGVLTFVVLLITLLLVRSATLEHTMLIGRALMGQHALNDTSLLLSAQIACDFNVLLTLVAIVFVFVAPPLLPLVEPMRRWKVSVASVVVLFFALTHFFDGAQTRVQSVLANRLGKGGNGVVPGHYGWLFDQRELKALTGIGPLEANVTQPHSPTSKAKDEILAFARNLKERGIPLVLVPIPMKASLYPEALTNVDIDDSPAPLYHPAQKALYEQLAKDGVHVLDITDPLLKLKARHKDAFLLQDSHWTPEAMQEIARAVTTHVRLKYPGLVPADPLILNTKAPDGASLGDLAERLYREPELVTGEESKVLVSFPDLESDPKSPITLLGDDFVSIFDDPSLGFAGDKPRKAGFAQHLALYLGVRIDTITVHNGAATEARKRFASRFEDEIRAKKLVIWLVPARDLMLSSDAGVDWSPAVFNSQSSPPQVLEPMVPKTR